MKDLEVFDLTGHIDDSLHQLREVSLVRGVIKTDTVHAVALNMLFHGHADIWRLHLFAVFVQVLHDSDRATQRVRPGETGKHLPLLDLLQCLLQSTL